MMKLAAQLPLEAAWAEACLADVQASQAKLPAAASHAGKALDAFDRAFGKSAWHPHSSAAILTQACPFAADALA
jgi:hypothetical protein